MAVRASTAAPGYFELFEKDGTSFRDGGMIANNPAAIALHEAKTLWPQHGVHLLLSCGTGASPRLVLVLTLLPGMSPPRSVQAPDAYAQLLAQVANSCAETEKTHSILEDTMATGSYYRLQPVDPLYNVALDEASPEKLDQLRVITAAWIEKNSDLFRAVATRLLAQIND